MSKGRIQELRNQELQEQELQELQNGEGVAPWCEWQWLGRRRYFRASFSSLQVKGDSPCLSPRHQTTLSRFCNS
jgi:hypothetical protein